jgi:hypothetical protein
LQHAVAQCHRDRVEELDRHPLVERHASESADGATRVTLASRSAD